MEDAGASAPAPPPPPSEGFALTDLGQELLMRTGTAAEPRPGRRRQCPLMSSLHALLTARSVGSSGRKPSGCTGAPAFTPNNRVRALTKFRPNRGMRLVDATESRGYTCQHSDDGSLLACAFQDRRVRVYETSTWKLVKDVNAHNLRWTVTDTALTPDSRRLAYASITPDVHLVELGAHTHVTSQQNLNEVHASISLSDHGDLGIWSIRFSPCGGLLFAGANDACLHVYDLARDCVAQCVRAHADDVNSVAVADVSGQLVYTASDDGLLKLWDRRCLGPAPMTAPGSSSRDLATPAGVLPGHLEGLTHVAARGDGRHCATNSKDQTLKLWDVRKMVSAGDFARMPRVQRRYHWDYRWMDYPGVNDGARHPNDCSIMTYRGHRVLETLIRCDFSPERSTGQRFLYTGSQDGVVYIFDVLTGEAVDRLRFHRAAVRDVSWHPADMSLVSCSFDGTVAEWSHAHVGGGLTKAYRARADSEGCPCATRRLEQAVSRSDLFPTAADGGGNGSGMSREAEDEEEEEEEEESIDSVSSFVASGDEELYSDSDESYEEEAAPEGSMMEDGRAAGEDGEEARRAHPCDSDDSEDDNLMVDMESCCMPLHTNFASLHSEPR